MKHYCEQEGKRHRQFDSCSRKRGETCTNETRGKQGAATMYTQQHESMRLVGRQDHGFVPKTKNARSYYQAGVSRRRSRKPVPAKHRQWGVRARPDSWTVTQSKRDEMVKREATITAGVLRPRYLRTYARPAPVNRAKGARLGLDRSQRFDEGNVEDEGAKTERW